MKTHARVVVIGGGVVGASVLYHLAKAGWSDAVLIERDELTSGSTWHAAGGMHTLNGDPNVAKLQEYTIKLYAEIERASGQSCGVHITGGVNLAGTPERMDFLKVACARARYLGLAMEIITVDEAQKLFPLLDRRYFVGALYNPLEGHVDPAGVTNAYAKAARNLGAEVYRFTRVTGLVARADGTWNVVTDKGTIHAEHVVNAGGLWAREVGRMAGLTLPVLAMEHQYVITGEMPEVAASPTEMLHVIDFEGEIYMRQEGRGMLIGTYEKAGVPWAERETPWNFTHELLAPDLDRIAPSLEVGFRHFPALERAGIKRVINGPFTFAPDGNPLIGPVRGLSNYWVACGVMAGFSQAGGVGLALANWMVDGDPGFDIWAMDVARFGDWASPAYTHAKVRENYSRRFRIRFPNEELPAARPLRTTPVYERLKEHGAVFGVAFGVEHALWFAPPGVLVDDPRLAEGGTYRGSAVVPLHRRRDAVRRRQLRRDDRASSTPSRRRSSRRFATDSPRSARSWCSAATCPAGLLGVGRARWPAASGRRRPRASSGGTAGATMIYTSGTTGKPKGALRTSSDASIVYAMLGIAAAARPLEEVHLTTGSAVPLRSADVRAARPHARVPGRRAAEVRRRPRGSGWSREHRVTDTFSAPTQLKRIVSLPAERARDAPTSRRCACLIANAAPVPYALKQEVIAKLGDGFLFEVYGSTELGVATILEPEDQLRKPGSCGKPYGGIEVQASSATTAPRPASGSPASSSSAPVSRWTATTAPRSSSPSTTAASGSRSATSPTSTTRATSPSATARRT